MACPDLLPCLILAPICSSLGEYLDPIRECYEAYVIYNFYAYLMAYLEDTVGDLERHLAKVSRDRCVYVIQVTDPIFLPFCSETPHAAHARCPLAGPPMADGPPVPPGMQERDPELCHHEANLYRHRAHH